MHSRPAPYPVLFGSGLNSHNLIDLKVVSSTSSTVGGYAPLTISFNPSTKFPQGGQIVLSKVIMNLASKQTDCTSLISRCDPFAASGQCSTKLSCYYDAGTSTATITTSYNSDIDSKTTITIAAEVQYNTKMTGKSLTVSTQASVASGVCQVGGISDLNPDIEASVSNSNDWIPYSPATFKTLYVTPSSGLSTCGSYSFSWNLIPSVVIPSLRAVVIQFPSSVSLTSAAVIPGVDPVSIDLIANKITVQTKTQWSLSPTNPYYFTISGIVLSPTDSTFVTTVTTYDSMNVIPTEVVHSQSATVSVSPDQNVNFGNAVTLASSPATVGEISSYQMVITPRCGTIVSASYVVTCPAPFSFTSDTCAGMTNCVFDSTAKSITVSPGVNLVFGTPYNLPLKMVNPPSTNATTTGTFAITTKSGTTTAFKAIASLSGVTISSGSFTSFSVGTGSAKIGDSCVYTFTVGINHPVAYGGFLKFVLNDKINWITSPVPTVSLSGTDTIYTYDSSTHLLVVNVNKDLAKGNITVTVTNIKNPYQTKTYTGFKVTATDKDGFDIDTASGGSIAITDPGTADVTCSILSTPIVNSARNDYQFTFTSPFPVPDGGVDNYLDVQIPAEVTGCTFPTPSPFSPSYNSDTSTYRLTLSAASGTDTKVTFTMSCINPPTTKQTNNFNLKLYIDSSNTLLRGAISVKTTQGASLSATSLKSNSTCTSCESALTLKFTRQSLSVTLSSIKITGIALDTATICQSLPGATSCSFSSSSGGVLVSFGSGTAAPTFEISNVLAENPDTVGAGTNFSVTTYTADGYIVDQGDNVFSLTAGCLSPCLTCVASTTDKCLTCPTQPVSSKYYYLKTQACILLGDTENCGDGYYKDTTNRLCLPCTAPCKNCDTSPTSCTECTGTLLLYKSSCYSDCPATTYKSPTELKCYDCQSPCKNCKDSPTTCTACSSDKILYGNTCVTQCPDGTYASAGSCLDCDTTQCAKCVTKADYCTACTGSTYLKDGKCITRDACVSGSKYVVDLSTHTCVPCDLSCLECEGTATKCTKCANNYVEYFSQCLVECPNPYYKLGTSCARCDSLCSSCTGSSDNCIKCIQGAFLITDKNTCATSCPLTYYPSGSDCIPCDSTCATCVGSPTTCASCKSPSYLYNGRCVTTCPDGTFMDGSTCSKCDAKCATCAGPANKCLSCPSNLYLDVTTCLTECATGKTPIKGACESCTGQCATCSGAVDFCISCKADGYVYGGKCYTTCPTGTLGTSSTVPKTCVDCDQGCEVCSWADVTNQTYAQSCVKCKTGYKYLDKKCYYVCPEGYSPSTDGLQCIKKGDNPIPTPNNNTNSTNTTSSKVDTLPYPHLIAGGFIGAIVAARQALDGRSLITTNLAIVFSYVTISTYVVQAYFAYHYSELFIAAVAAGAVVLNILINLFFLISYKVSISKDPGFVAWAEAHGCAKSTIVTFSTLFTMQTSRMFYSRFLGFETFAACFVDFANVMSPINCFSTVQIVFFHCPVLLLNVFVLIKPGWGSEFYVSLIESLTYSALMFILLCFEMKCSKSIEKELKEDPNYSKVADQSTLQPPAAVTEPSFKVDPDKLKSDILQSVLEYIGNTSRRSVRSERDVDSSFTRSPVTARAATKIKRRQSFSETSGSVKEKDTKKSRSYPCSPKTAKEKEVPLKQYGLDEDRVLMPHELPDNVYSDAVPPKDPKVVTPKPMVEAGAQTPAFKKADIFRKHLKAQENKRNRKRGKKLFESEQPGPLEIIQESPDDHEDVLLQNQGNPETNGMEFKEELVGKADASSSPISESKKDGMVRAESPELKQVVVEKEPEVKEDVKPPPPPKITEEAKEPPPGPVKMEKVVPEPAAQPANPPPEDSLLPKTKLPEITAFENSPSSLEDDGEEQSLPPNNNRPVHSPPQNLPESSDEVLSKPLNPIDERSVNPELKRLPESAFKTMVNAQKVPEVFDDNDGFKFSSTNVKGALPVPLPSEKPVSQPELVADVEKPDLSVPIEKQGVDQQVEEKVENEDKAVKVPEGSKPVEVVEKVPEDPKPVEAVATNPKVEEKVAPNPKVEEKVAPNPKVEEKMAPNPKVEEKPKPVDDSSKPLPPVEKHSEKHLLTEKAEPDNNTAQEELPQYINDEELMGSFEKDPADDCILIRENPEGILVDKRGRRVNKHGYLIDEEGNVINRNGELIFRKEELEKELGEDSDYPEPVVQNNTLFKEPDNSVIRTSGPVSGEVHPEKQTEQILVQPTKAAPTPVENFVAEKSHAERDAHKDDEDWDQRSRKSVSLDSLMGDTPSNYNIQNQRYDDPLDNMKQKTPLAGRPPVVQRPVEYEEPSETDVKMARAYGGKARGPAKRPRRHKVKNKSANKREVEKLFKAADRAAGFASDAEGKMEDTGSRPLAEISDTKLKSEADNVKRPEPFMEEVKSHTLRIKPQTARSCLRPKNVESQHRRAKSRKATTRDGDKNDELEKAYGQNIEDMFLYSDMDDEMSVGSIAPSNASRTSNKALMPKLKGLESIYLQRLESSTRHQKNVQRKDKSKGPRAKKGGKKEGLESGSEKDEIASLLTENYKAMEKDFFKQSNANSPQKPRGGADQKGGNPKLFH